MEKIGLINNIANSLDKIWDAQQKLEASPVMQARNIAMVDTLSLIKEVKKQRDIKLSLGVEEMLLRQELVVYANSHEQRNSVVAAIDQLQEARASLSVVGDAKTYQAATKTYGFKDRESGLPLDSFRKFLKSHSTRLANQMKSNLSVPEKNILRQRKENLGVVKEAYMSLQREALGLQSLDKAKGLGR